MKPQYRITRNYLDRSSPLKWLVRIEGEPVSAAIACEEVTAKNVRFVSSDETEQAYECVMVAITDEQPVMQTTREAAEQSGAVEDVSPPHNPDHLTPEQVGEGYRLVTEAEHEESKTSPAKFRHVELWEAPGVWGPRATTGIPLGKRRTYRVKVEAKPEPAPIADHRSEAPTDPDHNPGNVPADKIPAGFRLARKSEIDDKYHAGSRYWNRHDEEFKINDSDGTKDGANHLHRQTIIVPIEGYVAPEAEPVEELHNPGKLTPEQIGEGYRLLTKQEFKDNRNDPAKNFAAREFWFDRKGWRPTIVNLLGDGETYRVPVSAPAEPVRLSFDGAFKVNSTGVYLSAVKELHLKADGGIFAIL